MFKNKKGFTLVELMAVVLVLIIIVFIAINKVNKSTKDARDKTLIANAGVYIKAVNSYISVEAIDNENFENIYLSLTMIKNDIKINGTKPDTGNFTIEDSEVKEACLGYNGFKVTYSNGNFSDITKGVCDTEVPYSFEYTGDVQEFIVTFDGTYRLEVWGAQGGSSTVYQGGKGGYSVGTISLSKGDKLYVYVGGKGQDDYNGPNAGILNGGFNGGGYGRGWSHSGANGGGGGGATDIRLTTDSLYSRVIVAGGGGGTSDNGDGGYAGGLNSNSSATQTTGAAFGSGQDTSYTGGEVGGGGSGWYGGTAGASENVPGNGGSGYVYTSSSAVDYPEGCLLDSSNYLTNASTIDGSQTFKSPSGEDEIGHSGNGYAKITIIE